MGTVGGNKKQKPERFRNITVKGLFVGFFQFFKIIYINDKRMKCPKCEVTLSISDRQGIEIDYCPQCRGIWLDRGELDKIIERNAEAYSGKRRDVDEDDDRHSDRHDDRRHSDHDDDRRHSDRDDDRRGGYGQQGDPNKYRKKKSFLGEIFDFD